MAGAMSGRSAAAGGGSMHADMSHVGGMHQHGGAGQQRMTFPERQSMGEKMRGATASEERQALAAANDSTMERRARDKGAALPGPGLHDRNMVEGRGSGAAGN
jgi:hypothetical protein